MALFTSWDNANYYSIASNSDGDIPASGAWCVGIWMRAEYTNSDLADVYNYPNYLLQLSGSSSSRIWIQKDPATLQLSANLRDTAGNTINFVNGGPTSKKNRLVIMQRNDSGIVQFYACEQGGTPQLIGAQLANSFSVTNANTQLGYGFMGVFGEFFKGQFFLTADEIEAVANGAPIYQLKTLQRYNPLTEHASTIRGVIGNSNASFSGGSQSLITGFGPGLPTSFILPENTTQYLARSTGAGGSGGLGNGTNGGGGGGGGGQALDIVSISNRTRTTISFVFGLASEGNDGGDTTVNGYLIGRGGKKGKSVSDGLPTTGGAGGTATGGLTNLTGSNGQTGGASFGGAGGAQYSEGGSGSIDSVYGGISDGFVSLEIVYGGNAEHFPVGIVSPIAIVSGTFVPPVGDSIAPIASDNYQRIRGMV